MMVGQCVVSWCGGGPVCGQFVVGGQCVNSWCDVRSVYSVNVVVVSMWTVGVVVGQCVLSCVGG